jgi:hypothetical protein
MHVNVVDEKKMNENFAKFGSVARPYATADSSEYYQYSSTKIAKQRKCNYILQHCVIQLKIQI